MASAALVVCVVGVAAGDGWVLRTVPEVTGTPGQAQMTAEVVATFASAGLGDPGVVAVRFDTTDPWCATRYATVAHAADGSTVAICAGVEPVRHVLLHEFAHAWSFHHLDAATRAAFLDQRGLTTWAGEDVPAHRSGSEHAAEVIAWGLSGDRGPVLRLPDRTCDSLAAAFGLLTGVAPLTSLEGCDPAF